MRSRWLGLMLVVMLLVPATVSARVVLWTDFESGQPSGWSVVNNGAGGDGVWEFYDIFLYGSIMDGNFAIVDTLNYTGTVADTRLISNWINLSDFTDMTLEFDTGMLEFAIFEIDGSVKVVDDLGGEQEIAAFSSTHVEHLESLDVSGEMDGAPATRVIWDYFTEDAGSGYWAIDNVKLYGECSLTEDLQVDDGTHEVDSNGGVGQIYVNCFEPSNYPSHLVEVYAKLDLTPTALDAVDTIQWVAYQDPDGSGPPEGPPLFTSDPVAAVQDDNTWDLSMDVNSAIGIDSGSWCVGFEVVSQVNPTGLRSDATSPDGVSFADDGGGWETPTTAFGSDRDFAIRAVVDECDLTVSTVPTTTTTTTTTTAGSTTTTTSGGTTTTTSGSTTTTSGSTTTTAGSTTTTTSGSTTTTSGSTTTTTVTTTTGGSTTTTTGGADDDTDDDTDDDVDDDADDDTDDDTDDDVDDDADDDADDDVDDDFVPPVDDDDDDTTGGLGSGRESDDESNSCGC